MHSFFFTLFYMLTDLIQYSILIIYRFLRPVNYITKRKKN